MKMILGVQITSILFALIFLLFGVGIGLGRPHAVISIKQYKYLLWFIGILLAIFVFCFEPNTHIRWDLLEHYREVDAMRGKSYLDAVVASGYSGIFSVFVSYYFLVSRISNNALLPLIPVLIDYGIFVYIFLDMEKKQCGESGKIPVAKAIYITFVWFSTFGLKLAVSGMRCVLATAIVSYVVYCLSMKEKKNLFILGALYIIACLIHSFTLVFLLVFLITKIKYKKTLGLAVFLFASFGISMLERILPMLSTKSLYLAYSAEKIVRYWGMYSPLQIYQISGLGIVTVYVGMVLISLFLLLYSQYIRRNAQFASWKYSRGAEKMTEYASAVAVLALGASANYLFVERMMYIEAYALSMVFCIPTKSSKRLQFCLLIMIIVFFWVFLNNDITTFIVNYTRTR